MTRAKQLCVSIRFAKKFWAMLLLDMCHVNGLHVADPRTKDWMLMSGPMPLLTILITYQYFCISAGPRWMKDRKPFDLKNVLIVYNAIQVVFSVWLVNEVRACSLAYLPHSKATCFHLR
jgi:hypothetical protein